jgi:hypothetical protein
MAGSAADVTPRLAAGGQLSGLRTRPMLVHRIVGLYDRGVDERP